jgi:Ca2+-binding EF-hand superfamily protein
MSRSRLLQFALGVSLLGSGALAGAALADHRGAPRGFGPSWFDRLDADGDGRLTQAEIDDARRARLAEFDQDGDAQLSLEEYQALWLAVMRERMVDQFQALDADGDGVVTVDEYLVPYSRMVRRLDRNGDGEVTEDELRRRPRPDGAGRDGASRGRGGRG